MTNPDRYNNKWRHPPGTVERAQEEAALHRRRSCGWATVRDLAASRGVDSLADYADRREVLALWRAECAEATAEARRDGTQLPRNHPAFVGLRAALAALDHLGPDDRPTLPETYALLGLRFPR